MLPKEQGGIRIFRIVGISVFLHWSWFVVAVFEIQQRTRAYRSPIWNALEYLALFAIVTLHELGHSLACRQVGGTADRIVLWPLGGVAYVSPPQRPGATLWSIAAGPLVNVVLVPATAGLLLVARMVGWAESFPDAVTWLHAVTYMNVGILLFNLLPVYPLDGGQILRSLLWFVLGKARSLVAATTVGFLGVAGLVGLAFLARSPWLAVLVVFMGLNCWQGFRHALVLLRMARLPRHQGYACPTCRALPPIGALWLCGRCGQPFDTFETHALCPYCGMQFNQTRCVDCGSSHPIADWIPSSVTA